jgi:hypothetical protein
LKREGSVMAGLVPAIHAGRANQVQVCSAVGRRETRCSSEIVAPVDDVDTRHKAGHDADSVGQTPYLSAYADTRR